MRAGGNSRAVGIGRTSGAATGIGVGSVSSGSVAAGALGGDALCGGASGIAGAAACWDGVGATGTAVGSRGGSGGGAVAGGASASGAPLPDGSSGTRCEPNSGAGCVVPSVGVAGNEGLVWGTGGKPGAAIGAVSGTNPWRGDCEAASLAVWRERSVSAGRAAAEEAGGGWSDGELGADGSISEDGKFCVA